MDDDDVYDYDTPGSGNTQAAPDPVQQPQPSPEAPVAPEPTDQISTGGGSTPADPASQFINSNLPYLNSNGFQTAGQVAGGLNLMPLLSQGTSQLFGNSASSGGASSGDSSGSLGQQASTGSGTDAISKLLNGISGDTWAKIIGTGIAGIESSRLSEQQLAINQQNANTNSQLANLQQVQQSNTSSAGAFNLGVIAKAQQAKDADKKGGK